MTQYICQRVGQWGSYSTLKSIGFKNHDTMHVVKSVGESIKSKANQVPNLICDAIS